MEIINLEINILYFLCSPETGEGASHQTGTMTTRRLFEGFADIPAESIRQALRSMQANGLIRMDAAETTVSVSENGMHRLQASIACRTYSFDSCRCGMAD